MKKENNISVIYSTNPLIEKWDKFGFLTNINDDIPKINTVNGYELATIFILDNKSKYCLVDTKVFPVINSIFSKTNKKLPLNKILSNR